MAKEAWIDKGVELNKKIDIATGAFGLVVGSAPIVAFAVVSYFAGSEFGKWLKKREKN